jgi:hypothetical protein
MEMWATPPHAAYAAAAARNLLERLHYLGGISALRFAQQQVQMLGHDHVPDDHQAIPPVHLLQHFEEEIAIRRLLQQRQPVIATGGDEVEISGAVVATKFVGHPRDVTQNLSPLCNE